MRKFPINRCCPISGERHLRLLTYLPAAVVAAANPTYRPDFAEILRISAEDEFPIVVGPSGFVFSGWLPPDDFLRRVYEDVIDHSRTITETIEYRRALLELGGAFLQTVEKYSVSHAARPLRLLDFGCGYGALTQMLGGRDIKVFGYEPSAERSARASQGGFAVLDSLDKVADVGPFDLVVCTEVLEHVADPRGVLKFIKEHATSGGLLAITVPQCDPTFIAHSIAVFLRDRILPRVINPWEHLNYFSPQSLRRLLAEEGFEVVSDFGRAKPAYDDCLGIGEATSLRSCGRNGLRLMKRVLATSQSTELFCASA
jgi:2-polyprenyl-3-methyl-5-hydroxy-6-metoxy-1,4-benzoquinol methylase